MKTANSNTTADQITRMILVAGNATTITPDTFELSDYDDTGDVLDLYRRVTIHIQNARHVKEAVAARLAELLGEGGAACYGTNIVRYRQGSKETCHDPDGARDAFTHMAREGEDVGRWINPNTLRKTAMPKAFRDTFYERIVDAEATLTDIPIGKAPKFLRDMTDGETRTREDTK